MKMTKGLLLIAAGMLLGGSFATAQKKDKDNKNNPDYKFFYKEQTIETDQATFTLEDLVSRMDYSKLKIRIKNKTNDYLLFKPSECAFKYDGGKSFNSVEKTTPFSPKQVVIEPNETETKVLEIKTEGFNTNVDQFDLVIKGLYQVSSSAKVMQAPNFALPAKTNDFKAGSQFECNLVKLEKETKATVAEFECKYTGEDMGMIQPFKAVIKLENGQEFATTSTKVKTFLLSKGDVQKIKLEFRVPAKTADMQFANMDIVWKETFRDAKATALPAKDVKVTLDPGLTEGKNK